jgi:Zinc carboxypeptidase
MRRRIGSWLTLSLVLAVIASLAGAGGASADIAPPWCGTPEPDSAEQLPPENSFPHIPYYAIGCTLEDIRDRSNGRMSLEVIGQSSTGRDMYGVVINSRETRAQRESYDRLRDVLRDAFDDPEDAQELIERRDVKVPIFIQGGIHGNEYEGVDASMRAIERLATTPYGEDPEVDALLDHAVLVFNVIQNPDGRVAGTRANGNGFDLNRDYITQSQPETVNSVQFFREWLPTEALDLHGYVEPTLLEGTTVPHNPGIEYDIWLKWSQPRLDANQAALASEGYGITRPVNNIPPVWIPAGERLPQGWDDWGPFYTGQYGQLRGLDSSTVEACWSLDATECGIDGAPAPLIGDNAAMRTMELSLWSTLDFVIENRREMMFDQYEIYRRAVEDAARPELTDPVPVVGTAADHDYMTDYPRAHVIPVGDGQRSDVEAKRLVDFLLGNDIEVERLKRDYRFGGQEFEKGSYVVFMDQALRALGNTMLDVGDDISDRVARLYAPPGAWSNGFLWGADVVRIERGRRFSPSTSSVRRTDKVEGGVKKGDADWYALEVDSRTAVRTVNELVADGARAQLATEAFETRSGEMPAGSVLFSEDDERELRSAGRAAGLWFEPVRGVLPDREPIERVPRVACLCTALERWALEARLGFVADRTWTNNQIRDAATDPLVNYDVIYNSTQAYPANTPANQTVRARYEAFFARGGGYVGARLNGARFVAPPQPAAQVAGLQAESQGGSSSAGKATEDVEPLIESFGRVGAAFQPSVSGIVYWDNEARQNSPIVGAYPARDTALVETPVWFRDVPADMTVDGRLPQSDYLASGHWPNPDPSAGGSPIIVHGPNEAGSARITLFGIDPLFRAHPERSFPAVAGGFYWGDI